MPTIALSVREFENLSPRQQDDLLFAHTLHKLDFDLSDDYPWMTPADFRKLSGRQKRMVMQPVRGGAIANATFASAGLTTSITAYTAGDMLGTEVTWTGMAISAGKSATILSATMVDKAAVVGAVQLHFFTAASTPAADNGANSWSDANRLLEVPGYVPFPTPVASALNGFSQVTNLGLSFTTTSTSSLFGNAITQVGHTFFGAVGDLVYSAALLFD